MGGFLDPECYDYSNCENNVKRGFGPIVHGWLWPAQGRNWNRTSSFGGERGKVRNWRVSPDAVRPGEGLLTERKAGVQPVRRERVFMPLLGSCPMLDHRPVAVFL